MCDSVAFPLSTTLFERLKDRGGEHQNRSGRLKFRWSCACLPRNSSGPRVPVEGLDQGGGSTGSWKRVWAVQVAATSGGPGRMGMSGTHVRPLNALGNLVRQSIPSRAFPASATSANLISYQLRLPRLKAWSGHVCRNSDGLRSQWRVGFIFGRMRFDSLQQALRWRSVWLGFLFVGFSDARLVG
jgi:hypothetical protein